MTKLLVYIAEGQKFDLDNTIAVITSINGIQNSRTGKFIGSLFECEYQLGNNRTIVRISESQETITIEGDGDESLDFALKLQSKVQMPLWMIDMNYNFNLYLSDYSSIEKLRSAMLGS